MGGPEVPAFQTHLAVDRPVSAWAQIQALAVLLPLERNLLERDLKLEGPVRVCTRQHLTVVWSQEEARAMKEQLERTPALVVGMLNGDGLRL